MKSTFSIRNSANVQMVESGGGCWVVTSRCGVKVSAQRASKDHAWVVTDVFGNYLEWHKSWEVPYVIGQLKWLLREGLFQAIEEITG